MTTYGFPKAKSIFSDKPFSRENLARVFGEIFRVNRLFTGYLHVFVPAGPSYYLFLLEDCPITAGAVSGSEAVPLTIAEAVQEMRALPAGAARMSLLETDQPLLHAISAFFGRRPTAKAPVSMIDLEQILRQIEAEGGDALIILEKEKNLNFFRYRDGAAVVAYIADPSWVPPADLSLEEQMLLCAFQADPSRVAAHIYRDMTDLQGEGETVSREELTEMLLGSSGRGAKEAVAPTGKPRIVGVVVKEGEKETTYSVSLPCSVGRQGCDIEVSDPLVSRSHLTLREENGELFVQDLGSTNGTFLNGEQVTRANLSDGDVITIGDAALRVTRPSG